MREIKKKFYGENLFMHPTFDNCSVKPYISFRFISNCLQVEIETDRLFIRSYKPNDFENCISLYGNEAITKYFDYGKVRNELEIKNLIIEKGYRYFSKGKPFGLFSIFQKKSMAFIGQIDFLPSEELGAAEIGFILHEQYHNQGFCSEAVKVIIFDYVEMLNNRGFECDELPISKVIATVHPKNQPSKKVLQNVGMTLDKIQERFGQPRLWYSIPTS
ncbi:MAG: GNAT family N-acetyltransferase [Ignavibacteriae bacterium]|nr:GNAT family N-acetyltransferase [Ignavibacteriota bacterium]